MGQKLKTLKNQIELSYWHHSIRLDKLIILMWSDVQNRPERHFCPNFKWAWLGHFLSDFDIQPHQNDQLVEMNRIVSVTKLYTILLSFKFLTHFLLWGLQWAVLRAWTQNHPQVVGTCPGHHPNPYVKIVVSNLKGLGPGPPLMK